jgi:hypothetical protein
MDMIIQYRYHNQKGKQITDDEHRYGMNTNNITRSNNQVDNKNPKFKFFWDCQIQKEKVLFCYYYYFGY